MANNLLERADSLVRRYYDPTTGQFLSVDPAVDVTGTPYVYTAGDPVNGSDPLGLFCLGLCTFTNAVHYVAKHRKAFEVGAGVVLGVAAAATGVGAIAEAAAAATAVAGSAAAASATTTGFLLGASSAALGFGAAALDYGPCVHDHNSAACLGLGFGTTGAFLGGVGALGSGLVATGVIADSSLAAGVLGGVGAFGLNVGFAGTTLDIFDSFGSLTSLPSIEQVANSVLGC